MNSKDYRNIREAYLDVYNDDLTEEQEFKSWVTELLDEGYDLSDYTWDEMYDIYNEAYKGGPEFGMKYSKSKPLYDIILSHLIAEGYADTEQAAEAIMVNMSEEWRESIVETRMDPRGRPASGPMNVYANPKGKPSQAHLDAVKSYDAEQKKKTPEQRKAEQDAYRERQMNNK